MKHPIGFCVQGSAPEAVPAPAAPAETAAVPSVVRVFFPERGQAYSYYNDRFDCTTAIWSTSAASLPANADRWSQWTTISAFGSRTTSA